jgi:hypothetical protein
VKRTLVAAGVLALGLGAQAPALGASAPAAGGATAVHAAAAPRVDQLVVFRDGSSFAKSVTTKAARVKVGRRRCTAGSGTPLAALVRSKPGKLRLRDFGTCSSRAADGGGLFVSGIRGDLNRGQNGWVYKVGRRSATAGAADPGGPFGNGRLRAGQRVTWFYCRMRDGGCQRTLGVQVRVAAGKLTVTVRGYDDQGKGKPVAGAAVSASTAGAEDGAATDASGVATFDLAAGRYSVVATKAGLVRSFTERVEVP